MNNLNEEIKRSKKLMGLDEAIDWANVKHQTGLSCGINDLQREAIKFGNSLSKSARVEIKDDRRGGEYVQISFQHDIPKINLVDEKFNEVNRSESNYIKLANEFFVNFCNKGVQKVIGTGPTVKVVGMVVMTSLIDMPGNDTRYGNSKVVEIRANSTKPEIRYDYENGESLGSYDHLDVYINLYLNQ